MKTFSFKIKNTDVGDSDNTLVYDLNTIAGGTVTAVKAIDTLKLDDVHTLVTVSVTLEVADPS